MADPYPQNRAPLQPHLPGDLSQAAATRARLFEDEKKRVIQSCFSRVDNEGTLMESYITHCKVVEDAASPSAPPPLGGPVEQKKTRVIIVAVRSTGRVRMHKARENPNGLFQIGKTWNLDDLSAIENHVAPHEKGFTVTIIKPYYWQANSSKEKDFFISAVLKIYKKYTGGRIPRLVRFEGTEIDRMLEGAASLQAKQRIEVVRRGGEEQRDDDRGPSPVSLFSTSKPTPLRNLTSAVSMDNLAKSPGRQPPLRSKGIDGLRVGPGALRPSQSSDQLPNRRPLDPSPQLQPRGVPGNLAFTSVSGTPPPPSEPPPPIPPQGPGRRPSDGSSRPGRDSPSIRGAPAEDERGLRRTPSNEIFRTPSASSHQSREAMEQYPPLSGSSRGPPSEPSPVSSTDSRSPLKNKSSKDVASHFRLAANTYAAGGLMVDRRTRPKTPTTPSPTMSRVSPQDQERPNELPQIKYPMERRERDAGSGAGPYGTTGDVAGSMGEDRRTKARDPPATPMSSQRPPAQAEQKMEPPPRSNARGGTISSKDKSGPMFPLPTSTIPQAVSPNPQLKSESLDIPGASERRPGSPDRSGLVPDKEQSARNRSRSPNTKARKRKSVKSSYLSEVDTSRVTVDIEELLREFNWDPQGKVDALETKIKKEIADVEAGNVIVNTEGDARIQELSNLLDKAIEECDGMDALLTLYAVELTSLNDDIAHIENQSQGLQVQTANQKTLQRELQNLLSVISIMPQQLEVLKYGSLDAPQGLQSIEETLLALYKAMVTIDPKVARNAPESPDGLGRRGSWSDGGVGSMRALQEKKEGYEADTRSFMARMRQFMTIKFGAEVVELGKSSKNNRYSPGTHPKLVGHDSAYATLCRFSGLVAFARDVDLEEYLELQKVYERPVSQLFQDEFRDHILAWKKIAKRPLQDELDLLFTAQEKETDNVAVTAARKLTVKKSQTLARIRSPTVSQFRDKNQDGSINPNEAFAGALSEIYRLVLREQNFLVEFFQMSSQSPQDFVEFCAKSPPAEQRRFEDLGGLKSAESDKGKARMVFEFLTELFSFLPQELQNFVEWATKTDPLQGVGVLYSIEEKIATLEVTDQEFMLKMLQKLQARLAGLFSRFLDDQVKAIEDTKVKIKKRKGVIPFMKVFPAFASKVEEQLPVEVVGNDELDIRDMVNDGYERINKAMFESLHAIAKESPTVANQSVDPEDKEQLNYHVMMIENMHHYLEEVFTRGNSVLEVFKKKAERDFAEHVELYVGAVIRRPLGKLLDFVESVEVLQRAGADDISSRQSHNKHAFKKVLGHHDSKEIRRGIETLRKRVDKHFADSDDAALCARLLEKLSSCLEKEYIETHRRVQKLLLTVYKDSGLEMEFLVADIIAAFKK